MVLQCNNGVGLKSRRGKNKNLTALKSNSNTVWFNFQTYIIFSINLVSFKVTLRSSGTDILYGCHLLLDVCIIYFISCDCIVNNSSLSYPIYSKIAELDCCQIIILSICVPSTHAYTHVLRLSLRFALRDKVTLRLLKLLFLGSGCSRVV